MSSPPPPRHLSDKVAQEPLLGESLPTAPQVHRQAPCCPLPLPVSFYLPSCSIPGAEGEGRREKERRDGVTAHQGQRRRRL